MKPRWTVFVTALLGVSCGGPESDPVTSVSSLNGTLVERTVLGLSLSGNRLREPTTRKILVYLPPGYNPLSSTRYPVVYLLAGLGGDHRNFASDGTPNRLALSRPNPFDLGLDMKAIADDLINTGQMPPSILVGINGMNSYANHWFSCSDVIGDYRGFVVRDVVNFVDLNYRTLPDRDSRALIGHSSGAFGALSLGIRFPSRFGAIGILSPAANDFESTIPGGTVPRLIELFFLVNPNNPGAPVITPSSGSPISNSTFAALWGSTPAGGSFVTNVIYSAAAAFSPDHHQPFDVDLPVIYPQKVIDTPTFAKWLDDDLVSQVQAGAGNLADTDVYLARGLGPTVLHPEVGDIPLLRNALVANNVTHTFEELAGDHFTSLPQSLRNSLVFVGNSFESFSAQHRRPHVQLPSSGGCFDDD